MDRGIPTEEVLEEMRQQTDPPVLYLVGTPKGRLSKLEAAAVAALLAGSPSAACRSSCWPKGRNSMCWSKAKRG